MLDKQITHMNVIDKTVSADICLGHLLDVLSVRPMPPLVFSYDGSPVRSGYHVTEVKAGMFSALDRGANPEAWSEIFVQLWDIDEDGRTCWPEGLQRSSARFPTMFGSSRRQS